VGGKQSAFSEILAEVSGHQPRLEQEMNKELEATLVHVLRMPDHWQKQAAKALLPTVYKWQTRISLPHLSDEEFDQQWRATHRPGLLQRMVHALNSSKKRPRLPGFMLTAKNWTAAVTKGFRSLAQHGAIRVDRKGSSRGLASRIRSQSIQPETDGKSDRSNRAQLL
jgi:hypothetical protein